MNFDTIEQQLINFIKLENTPMAAAICTPETFYFANRCLKFLRTPPRYKIYSLEELTTLRKKEAQANDEHNLICRNLPYDSFTVVSNNEVTFFEKSTVIFDNPSDISWITGVFVLEPLAFFGPIGVGVSDDRKGYASRRFLTKEHNNKLNELAKNVAGEATNILLVLSFCHNNVVTIDVPEKIQIKRAKNGKFPNYHYNILTIDPPALNQIPKEQRYKIVNRLRPCEHDRTGHVRHLKTKNIWIEKQTINKGEGDSLGRLIKDYAVVNR